MRRSRVYFFLFIVFLSILLSYLVGIGIGVYPNVFLFWISIVSMSITVLCQIFDLKASTKLTILEILLLTLALHLIFTTTYGLYEYDVHYDYYAAKEIMQNGWPPNPTADLLPKTKKVLQWPVLHILSSIVSEITGVDLFLVAKWIPSIISSVTTLFVYLFFKRFFGSRSRLDDQSALLASFGFSSMITYISHESKFRPSCLATVLFFVLAYSVESGKKREFCVLTLLLIPTLILTHHLTAFMWLFFLFIISFAHRALPFLPFKLRNLIGVTRNISRAFKSSHFLILVFSIVSTLTYWGYFAEEVLFDLTRITRGLFSPQLGQYAFVVSPPRVIISLYLNVIIAVAFFAAIVHHLLKYRCRSRLKELPLLTWVGMLFGFYLTFVFVKNFAHYMDVTRFQIFGWPFLLMLAAHATSKTTRKRLLSLLFIGFVLIQVYSIPPYIYDHSLTPDYQYGRVRMYYLPQEYEAVFWINSSQGIVGDATVFELVGGLRQIKVTLLGFDTTQSLLAGNYTVMENRLLFYRMEDSYCVPPGGIWRSTELINLPNDGFDLSFSKLYDNGVDMYAVAIYMVPCNPSNLVER